MESRLITSQVRRIGRLTRLSAALFFGGLVLLPAQSADSVRVGAYDFNYLSTGDSAARPVQVFDDGRSTYLQFRPGMVVPAIFSNKSGAPQLLVPAQEGPYVKVPELHGRFLLQVGRAQAQVMHGGARFDTAGMSVSTPAGQQPYVPGTPYPAGAHLVTSVAPVPLTTTGAPAIVDDMLERNSYATPRKGDNLTWQKQAESKRDQREIWFKSGSAALTAEARNALIAAAKATPAGARVTVIGRDDETFKDGLDRARGKAMRDVLVRAGLSPERVTVRQGVSDKQSGQQWASTLVIESGAEEVVAAGGSVRRSSAVTENLQALVRAGVLRLEQAEHIARGHGMTMGGAGAQGAAPAAAATPQAIAAAAAVPDVRRAGAPAASVTRSWEMRKADGSLDRMLTRWANEAGWTLVWRDAPAIAVTGDMQLPASDFLAAADLVVRRAQEVGYRIHAAAYSNQTLVVSQGK